MSENEKVLVSPETTPTPAEDEKLVTVRICGAPGAVVAVDAPPGVTVRVLGLNAEAQEFRAPRRRRQWARLLSTTSWKSATHKE